MSEVTGLRNVALPYPVYGVPFGLTFPILDADGDPVSGASGLDSEVSKNGDTYADCTNEATEIATSSGTYYLLLTATEMTADVVSIIVKTSTTGAKTTILTLYPRKLVPLRSGTAQGGAAGYITLDAGAGSRNDMWNGCLCVATIDSNVEARIIDDYNGSNQQASITPDWNVTPDSDDTFIIYLPEGVQIPDTNVTAFGGTAGTFASGRPEVNTTHISGSSTAANNAEIVFDTDFATNYDMTLDAWMVNVYSFSTGAISAGAFGTGAISADALGSDAVEEIRDSVVAIFTDDVGTAQAGAAGTITLRSGAVATDDYYNGAYVTLTGGTGVGQTRKITDYVGSTKVATLDSNWVTNPDNTSTYIILGRAV
jgi:hypothetical protein